MSAELDEVEEQVADFVFRTHTAQSIWLDFYQKKRQPVPAAQLADDTLKSIAQANLDLTEPANKKFRSEFGQLADLSVVLHTLLLRNVQNEAEFLRILNILRRTVLEHYPYANTIDAAQKKGVIWDETYLFRGNTTHEGQMSAMRNLLKLCILLEQFSP